MSIGRDQKAFLKHGMFLGIQGSPWPRHHAALHSVPIQRDYEGQAQWRVKHARELQR